MEKLRNLEYVSLKEYGNLDKIEIIYVDVLSEHDELSENNKLDKMPNVFTNSFVCGTYNIDEDETVEDAVEQLFVEKLKTLDIEDIDNIEDGFKLLDSKRKDRTSKEKFILAPINSNLDYENIIETKHLKDEIYFGYKTDIDEPGIVLVTNEDGIKDKNKLRIGLIDIGFFPNKMFYKLKM